MKQAWIRWAGGIETRDDGYTIYHDPRWAMVRYPDGRLEKHATAEIAKRFIEAMDKLKQVESTAKDVIQGIDDAMVKTFEMVPEVILWENTMKGGDR
jgi:hypothetical protein